MTITTQTLPDGRTVLACTRCKAERLVPAGCEVGEDESIFAEAHEGCA